MAKRPDDDLKAAGDKPLPSDADLGNIAAPSDQDLIAAPSDQDLATGTDNIAAPSDQDLIDNE